MTALILATREVLYRKASFMLALLSVTVAVASLTAVLTLMRDHDAGTQAMLLRKQAELERQVTGINDDIRKAMSRLGFNIVILPGGQDLGDWYSEDYASKYMPEEYVEHLAGAGLQTIEHLVPSLRQKLAWPETKWTVLLVGLGERIANPASHSGEIPFDPVPRGMVMLGYEIHQALGFEAGQRISLAGREFTVYKCSPERGTKDDVTVWLNLQDAQELVDKKGMVNEIRALETQAGWSNISAVRREIERILPDTQVVEITSLASAQTAARTKALQEGELSIRKEIERSNAIRTRQARLSWVIVSLVLVICTAWLGLLSFANARDRGLETAILMSLGYAPRRILHVFLTRSLVLALVGGIAGFWGGTAFGTTYYDLLTPALLVALGITALATWLPVTWALRNDPADILQAL